MEFPVNLKSLIISVTAMEGIQTFWSMGKCMVLTGGAILGMAFFFINSLLLNLLCLCHKPAPQLCNQEVDIITEGQSSATHFTNKQIQQPIRSTR